MSKGDDRMKIDIKQTVKKYGSSMESVGKSS